MHVIKRESLVIEAEELFELISKAAVKSGELKSSFKKHQVHQLTVVREVGSEKFERLILKF